MKMPVGLDGLGAGDLHLLQQPNIFDITLVGLDDDLKGEMMMMLSDDVLTG